MWDVSNSMKVTLWRLREHRDAAIVAAAARLEEATMARDWGGYCHGINALRALGIDLSEEALADKESWDAQRATREMVRAGDRARNDDRLAERFDHRSADDT